MCTEWNRLFVSEMDEIRAAGGAGSDIKVDQLFDRLRLKTSSQLSVYATTLTDRYHGAKALEPYLEEYKLLCHELKQPGADNHLSSSQVCCTAPPVKPSALMNLSKARKPVPCCLKGNKSAQDVQIIDDIAPTTELTAKLELC